MRINRIQLDLFFVVLLVLLLSFTKTECKSSSHRRHIQPSTSKYLPLCKETKEDKVWLLKQLKIKCKCPSTIAPVCGTDDITYENRCYINCAAKIKFSGFQRGGRALKIKKMEPCDADYNEYRRR